MALLLHWLACATAPTIGLTDDQNYTFTSALSADCQPVKAATDLTVSWDGLDADLLGGAIDPTRDVDAVTFGRFAALSRQEVLDGIDAGGLSQRDVTDFAEVRPADGVTSARLGVFATVGNPLDVTTVVPEGGTFLLEAAQQLEDRASYLTFTFLCPDAAETNTDVVLGRDTATLAWDVDLSALAPIEIGGASDAVVDWSGLARSGSGGDFVAFQVDRLRLVRYDADADALEADLLHAVPSASYSADVGGWAHWSLSRLEPEFSGFEGDGTWWLALDCTTCLNPAPLFLGRVSP